MGQSGASQAPRGSSGRVDGSNKLLGLRVSRICLKGRKHAKGSQKTSSIKKSLGTELYTRYLGKMKISFRLIGGRGRNQIHITRFKNTLKEQANVKISIIQTMYLYVVEM